MNITIPTRQAVQSLAETNLIRVLREIPDKPGLVPRFLPRAEVIRLISENQVQDVGSEAKAKGFTMSLKNEEGVYFIEGKQ